MTALPWWVPAFAIAVILIAALLLALAAVVEWLDWRERKATERLADRGRGTPEK